MPKNETIWAIRAGSDGDGDGLFLQQNRVGIGWSDMGDLSGLPANPNAFKARVIQAYPAMKPGAVPVTAGMLLRFVHTIQPGDIVVYRSKIDRQIHIGKITGPYQYNASIHNHYHNLRSVKWEQTASSSAFSQGALAEMNSAMTLFQIKHYAQEVRNALSGTAAPPPVEADETAMEVGSNPVENTEDFILKTLAQELKGHPFADFVAHLLGTMGYRSRVSPPGPDGGVDIIAHKDELGFEPPLIKVQIKSTTGSIGLPEVSALYGNVGHNEFGLFVTLGGFTPPARNFAKANTNLRLINGSDLVGLILQHYEQFDSRYKGLLPLKRVYVPELPAQLS